MRSKMDVDDSAKKATPSRNYDLGVLKLMTGIVSHSFSAPPNGLFKSFLPIAIKRISIERACSSDSCALTSLPPQGRSRRTTEPLRANAEGDWREDQTIPEQLASAAPDPKAERRPHLSDSSRTLQVTGCSDITVWRKRQTQGLITFRCFSNLIDEHRIEMDSNTVERSPIAWKRKSAFFRRPRRRLRGLNRHYFADATLQGERRRTARLTLLMCPLPSSTNHRTVGSNTFCPRSRQRRQYSRSWCENTAS
ncbi:hypothetical protein M728_005563 (plasmid) [Ensifer sp. WSM1721]